MIALAILASTLTGIAAGFLLRRRLADMKLISWMGWLLIGAGTPVMLGQLVALSFTEIAVGAARACEAGNETVCHTADMYLVMPLTAGLCGGLGWLASVISARLTTSRQPD